MSAMTENERKRKSRVKLKKENPDEVRIKKRLEMQKYRKNRKMREALLSESDRKRVQKQRRKNERDRKRKQREQRKIDLEMVQGFSQLSSCYGSKAAKYKAVRKARKALPPTPRRQKEVVRNLAQDFQLIHDTLDRKKSSTLCAVEVIQFFNDETTSYCAPGRKDYICIKDESGQRIKVQKRYLKYKLSECFDMFKSANPNFKIGFSKFCGLRPPQILTSRDTPLTSCLCFTHENFRLIVDALSRLDSTRFCHLNAEKRNECVCDIYSRKCWMQQCKVCGDGEGLKKLWNYDGEENWEIVDSSLEYKVWKSDGAGILKKRTELCGINELISKAIAKSSQFLKHCYINKKQANAFKQDRNLHNNATAVLQVDFAENFSCVPQDEVQSSYWSRSQISLFTSVFWHTGSTKSFCISSDTKVHSKNEIFVFLKCILQRLPKAVRFVKVWSDGPSSQFKNRYIAVIMQELSKILDIAMEWNFFCAGHGKGAVDGVGGSVKRSVYELIKSRRAEVHDLESFQRAFSMVSSKVEMISVSENEVTQEIKKFDMATKFLEAKPLHGISLSHQISFENQELVLSPLSEDETSCSARENEEGRIGLWVSVIYDNTFAIGEITNVIGSEVDINFMESCGANRFRWPERKDTDRIYFNTILCKICSPEVHSGAGRILYTLPVNEYQRIVNLFIENT